MIIEIVINVLCIEQYWTGVWLAHDEQNSVNQFSLSAAMPAEVLILWLAGCLTICYNARWSLGGDQEIHERPEDYPG